MIVEPGLRLGSAALMIRNGAYVFVFIVQSNCSVVISRIEACACRPALLTTMSRTFEEPDHFARISYLAGK